MALSIQKKQVILLYGSSIMGLFLGVINSVINTRNLEPIQYGDVRYVQNVISLVSSLLLFGFFTSGSRLLALSPNEQYSRSIRGAMCAILGVAWLVLGVVLAILGIISYDNGDSNLVPLYFVSVFLGGNVILLNYINTTAQGDNQIGRISVARLIPSFLYAVLAGVIYARFGASPLLLISLNNGLAVFILLWVILSTRPSFKNIKKSLRLLNEENKKYGFQVYLGALAGVSTTYLAGITLGQFCENNTEVGFYTLALTLSSPLSMLPGIIGTIYFRQFASQNRIEKKILIVSVVITFVSLIIYVLFIDLLIKVLYDESYYAVGIYASLLAIGASVHGVGDMFNRFLGSHGHGKDLRNGAFVCGLLIVFGSVILVYYYQIVGAVITKILGSFAYMSMMIFYYLRFVRKNK